MSAESGVIYLAGPDAGPVAAQAAAAGHGVAQALPWSRRGIHLGWIGERARPGLPDIAATRVAWQAMSPILLAGYAAAEVQAHTSHIEAALRLMQAVLDGSEAADLLAQEPYASRLAPQFELLCSIQNEGEPQEIETLEFDAVDGPELVAENLWIKLSWLSYEEDDSSLRFRFSFGMADYEDVAADWHRQQYAAQLTEAVFPESQVISGHAPLAAFLRGVLGINALAYVERIIYFNAPNGGAQFHQDVERGHLGVVFAQLSGRTGWLALSKDALLDEITAFLSRPDADAQIAACMPDAQTRRQLYAQAQDRTGLSAYLDTRDNDPLDILINRVPGFTRQLIERGHGRVLQPGDVLLLPQGGMDHCCWHSVFCLDDVPGHALSFAVRGVD